MHAETKAHGVQVGCVGTQRNFYVAKALAPSQLGKGHDAKLFGASQAAHTQFATVVLNNARKASPWDELHDLRKQSLADIHRKPPRGSSLGNCTRMWRTVSNRHQTKSTANHRQYWLYSTNCLI